MSREMPMIVSHYTRNTGYEREVLKLSASLARWGLASDITVIDSLGSWRANSNYCSVIVQQALARYPGRDVLRVDADAVFQRYPDLFRHEDFTADVAAHVHDFRWHPRELLGGTLFFRNTPAVRVIVDSWVVMCMKLRPQERNGDLLQELLHAFKNQITFAELPAAYCKIFDLMREVPDPVIEHFQASRRFKRLVNAQGGRI